MEISKEKVMYIDQLRQYIENRPNILNIEQVEKAYKKINDNRVTNKEYLNNHSYNVKCYIDGKKEKAEKGICPRCYGKLVLRKSRYGEFYGCSNYPNCKYTQNINKYEMH